MNDPEEGSSVDPGPLSSSDCPRMKGSPSSPDIARAPQINTPGPSELTTPYSSRNAWSSRLQNAAQTFWRPLKTVILKAVFPSTAYQEADTCNNVKGNSIKHSETEDEGAGGSSVQLTSSPTLVLTCCQSDEDKSNDGPFVLTAKEHYVKENDLFSSAEKCQAVSRPAGKRYSRRSHQKSSPTPSDLTIHSVTLETCHNPLHNQTLSSPGGFVNKLPIDSQCSRLLNSVSESSVLSRHYACQSEVETSYTGFSRSDTITSNVEKSHSLKPGVEESHSLKPSVEECHSLKPSVEECHSPVRLEFFRDYASKSGPAISECLTSSQQSSAIAERLTSSQQSSAIAERLNSSQQSSAISECLTSSKHSSSMAECLTSSQQSSSISTYLTSSKQSSAVTECLTSSDRDIKPRGVQPAAFGDFTVAGEPTLTERITESTVEEYQELNIVPCPQSLKDPVTEHTVEEDRSTEGKAVQDAEESIKDVREITAGLTAHEGSGKISEHPAKPTIQVTHKESAVQARDVIYGLCIKESTQTTTEPSAVEGRDVMPGPAIRQVTQESTMAHGKGMDRGMNVKGPTHVASRSATVEGAETTTRLSDTETSQVTQRCSAEKVTNGVSLKGTAHVPSEPPGLQDRDVPRMDIKRTTPITDESSTPEDATTKNRQCIYRIEEITQRLSAEDTTPGSARKPGGGEKTPKTDTRQSSPRHRDARLTATDTGSNISTQPATHPCRSTSSRDHLADPGLGTPLTRTSHVSPDSDRRPDGHRTEESPRGPRPFVRVRKSEGGCTDERASRWFTVPRFPANHHVDPSPTLSQFDPTTFRGYHFLRDF